MNFKEFETAQKLRGGYYTDPAIASFLARWVSELHPKRVLEPSCGDGAFIEAMRSCSRSQRVQFVGCELNPVEASVARSRGAEWESAAVEIVTGDFLEWTLESLSRGLELFDAVVGNPPFIRYQYLDALLQERAERVFDRFGLPFTKHTNAWVPFVISSVALLRPGGRIAMVVPSEVLHVLHAKGLRDFLLSQCSRVLLLDPQDILFEDTLQGVMLLLAEKKGACEDGTVAQIAVTPISGRSMLNSSPSDWYSRADFVPGNQMNGKWMLSLLSRGERDVLQRIERNLLVRRFKDVATVDVGIVTGANKFFLVPDDTVKEFKLDTWAHPAFGRSEHVRGVIYDKSSHSANRRAGLPANLIWFRDTPLNSLPKLARKYIAAGEEEDLHLRYKCRIRSPWYSVPSVYSTGVGMLKRSHFFPRLILNKARAFTTDTAYRIRSAHNIRSTDLVAQFVNSLTALTAELEGRHYGGGVLELVPSEIEKLLVPSGRFDPGAVKELHAAVAAGTRPVKLLSRQDETILRPIGIRPQDYETMRTAWQRLCARRQRKDTTALD